MIKRTGELDQRYLKDSGARDFMPSGMMREPQHGRPRFDLLLPKGIPYDKQFLTRLGYMMAHGADKYEDRNWELADSQAELDRFQASAARHFFQWLNGETDEDHAAALVFNVLAFESTLTKAAYGVRSNVLPEVQSSGEAGDRSQNPELAG